MSRFRWVVVASAVFVAAGMLATSQNCVQSAWISPASPSNDSQPVVHGTTSQPNSPVRVFLNSACEGSHETTTTAGADKKFSVQVSVPENASTEIYVSEAIPGSEGNCTFVGTYVHDMTGGLDESFGQEGRVVVHLDDSSPSSSLAAIALDPEGRIVLAGGAISDQGQAKNIALARLNADGSLDASFGVDGTVAVDIPGYQDYLQDVVVQADGRILTSGWEYSWTHLNVRKRRTFLTRHLLDGSLDPSFGEGGMVFIDGYTYNRSMLLVPAEPGQTEEKAVVVGSVKVTEPLIQYDLFAARFNGDGTLDATFGDNGIAIVDLPDTNEESHWGGLKRIVARQSDGGLVLLGRSTEGAGSGDFLVRLNEDGSFDAGFGDEGLLLLPDLSPSGVASGVVVDDSDRIVVFGSEQNGAGDSDMVVRRFDGDGALDLSFGNEGVVWVGLPGASTDQASEAALDAGGRIVLAGSCDWKFCAVRLTDAGSIDQQPGELWRRTTDFTSIHGTESWARAVAIQPDGSPVVGGVTRESIGSGRWEFRVGVARYAERW